MIKNKNKVYYLSTPKSNASGAGIMIQLIKTCESASLKTWVQLLEPTVGESTPNSFPLTSKHMLPYIE